MTEKLNYSLITSTRDFLRPKMVNLQGNRPNIILARLCTTDNHSQEDECRLILSSAKAI